MSSTTNNDATVNQAFLQALHLIFDALPPYKGCHESPDDLFLSLGVQRVLESSESGRGFLQEHGPRFENSPDVGGYFAPRRSTRRGEAVREVGHALLVAANQFLPDRLEGSPSWPTTNVSPAPRGAQGEAGGDRV